MYVLSADGTEMEIVQTRGTGLGYDAKQGTRPQLSTAFEVVEKLEVQELYEVC